MPELRPVASLSFGELIGETKEPNTISGGVATVDLLLQLAQLHPGAQVLEIGSATGPTCLEIAACRPDVIVTGIDTDPSSVSAATQAARKAGLDNVTFVVADAREIPAKDGTYDLVSTGNVPTFVPDRDAMIAECVRVTRPHGIVAAAPIYYLETPPETTRAAVEAAIGAPIKVWSADYWLKLYTAAGLVLRQRVDRRFRDASAEDQAAYARWVMSRAENDHHDPVRRKELEAALALHYDLFNTNLRYTGYSVLIFRNAVVNREPILFGSVE